MNAKLIIDIIGWVGSIEVILAFGLNSYHLLDARSWKYQVLNLTGGVFLIINTAYYHAYPSTAINVIWVIIATLAIVKILKAKPIAEG